MSSFTTKMRNRRTREIEEIHCLDDYHGRHRYGYQPVNSQQVLTERQLEDQYEEVA